MLDESPESLIYSAIENFETQPDIASLNRIKETLKKTEELRQLKIERLQDEQKKLEQELEEVSTEMKRLSTPSSTVYETVSRLGKGPSTDKPAEQDVLKLMNDKSVELDNLKVSLAKQLTDLESSINQLSMTKINLARQKEEFSVARSQTWNLNIASNFNSSSMKISLYKSLGVHIEDFEQGNDQIIIFDKSNNLTSVLQVDEKYLDYFISNYIWDHMGS